MVLYLLKLFNNFEKYKIQYEIEILFLFQRVNTKNNLLIFIY